MKHLIAVELLKALRSNPNLFRKVKIYLAVGLIGLFLFGGLTIWAGLYAVNHIASSANNLIQSPELKNHVTQVTSELKQVQVTPVTCWERVQTLGELHHWLQRPLQENIHSLKIACLKQ